MAQSMFDQPTLIILATSAMPDSGQAQADALARPALPDFQKIAQTLDLALETGLPVVMAASRWIRQQCEVFAPDVTCVEAEVLNPPTPAGAHWVRAVSQAVLACPQAPGWLLMPTAMPGLAVSTLHTLCATLRHAAIVCPSHQMQTGFPLGFSAEFYSELVRLETETDLRRLLTRYPLTQMETDDPAVLPWEQPGRLLAGTFSGRMGTTAKN